MTHNLISDTTGQVVATDDRIADVVKAAIGHDGEAWEFRDVPGYPDQRALWTRRQGRAWTQTVVLGYGSDDAILAEHAHQIADWYGFTICEVEG